MPKIRNKATGKVVNVVKKTAPKVQKKGSQPLKKRGTRYA